MAMSDMTILITTRTYSHGGCLAHVRRKFDEAKKARGKTATKTGGADVALHYIGALYRIESEAKKAELSAEELRKPRWFPRACWVRRLTTH
jgi:transposase